jgi:NedA-like, galactose-binding domain
MRRTLTNLTLALVCLALLGPVACRKVAKPPAAPPAGAKTEAALSQPPLDMAAIEIRLPKPMFKGTPKPVSEPNIEKPSGKLRPPFLAPSGAVNLALNKPVTSSDPEPIIGELSLITDGDKDGQEGYFVELGFGTQWVQIDLEQPATLYAVIVWHYHAQARAYRDVVVQVSNDPEFASDVTTVFNSDHDDSSSLGAGTDMGYVETFEGKLIDCRGARGRYVRLYSRGNTSNDENHYIEVEVYGKPSQ